MKFIASTHKNVKKGYRKDKVEYEENQERRHSDKTDTPFSGVNRGALREKQFRNRMGSSSLQLPIT
jgi:hypothetical protein